MLSAQGLQPLLQDIHRASLDRSLWHDVVTRLSAMSGGIWTQLFSYDAIADETAPLAVHGYDPDFLTSYVSHYGQQNAWAPGFAKSRPGSVISCDEMIDRDVLTRTEFYMDWVRPQENIMAGAGSIVMASPRRIVFLGGNIRLADQDRLERPWINTVGLIAPVIRHALEVDRMLSDLRTEGLFLRRFPVVEGSALLLLTHTRRVAYANPTAEAMIEEGSVLRQTENGRLRLTAPAADARLDTALAQARMGETFAGASFHVRISEHKSCEVRTLHLGDRAPDLLPFRDRSMWDMPLTAVVVAAGPKGLDVADLLRQHHGMTLAEADVVIALHAGKVSTEIAADRKVSTHTVRNQIKSALSKTDMRRQSDLTRLVERLRRSV